MRWGFLWLTLRLIMKQRLRTITLFCSIFFSSFLLKLDIENPIIRINTAFKGCSSLEKISVLPRIYHN